MSLVELVFRCHPAWLLWGQLAEVGDVRWLYLQASPPSPSPPRRGTRWQLAPLIRLAL